MKDFSSTRKMDPSARGGVVVDIVNSNCVSDNFVLTCLLLLLHEDVIKYVRISSLFTK